MRFTSIGSGSRGNGTLICHGGEGSILLDCGFSARDTLGRMAERGVGVSDLAGILVTHEHSDHIKGVARLAVYTTWGTYCGGLQGQLDEALLHCIEPDACFMLAGLSVQAVPVPHDAREPCQFVVSSADAKLGVLSDCGSITRTMLEHYRQCDALMLECNHDLRMLAEGPYPPQLKRRVAGAKGHLSNEQALEFLNQVGHTGLQHVVVTHISQKNNLPELALSALAGSRYCNPVSLKVAHQQTGLDWIALQSRTGTDAGHGRQIPLNFEF